MDLHHFIRVVKRILTGGTRTYSSARLFFDYLRLLLRSVLYHKIRKFHDRMYHQGRCTLLGFDIGFNNYGDLIDLVEEIFIYEVYKGAPANGVIIDCGANIGLSVLYLRMNYPSSRIIAFEPALPEYQMLCDNIKLNKIQNIEPLNFALGEKEGIAYLVNTSSGSSLTRKVFFSNQAIDGPSVSVRRLSPYIESKVALLKIDIEGAEVSVLRDLLQSKKVKFVTQMVIEFHHEHAEVPLEDFLQMLIGNGFVCRHEQDPIHLSSAFTKIYAFRKN